jgi:SagB-type dehydrogenase family enzyme
MQDVFERHRYFLKDTIRKTIDFSETDQSRRLPAPPVEKPYHPDAELIDLVRPNELDNLPRTNLLSIINNRQSRRKYSNVSITPSELSFLLWATQGIKQQLDSGHALRTVPSAGARHALETYLGILNVSGFDMGFYRYLPLEHKLLVESRDEHAAQKIADAAFNQNWMSNAAVILVWSAVPYRMEWRYGLAAHKVILLDAGHVGQNLYLACEAIGAGTCAVAAYDQEALDDLLKLDGNDEFAVYMAAVGKL